MPVLLTTGRRRRWRPGQRSATWGRRRILELHSEARREVTGRKVPVTGELSLAASSVPGATRKTAAESVTIAFRKKYMLSATICGSASGTVMRQNVR